MLDELMQLDGALAAFEFDRSGELKDSRIAQQAKDMNTDVLDMLSHVCVANGAIATMQARGWEKVTGMEGFYPIKGFSVIGFEWTVVVNNQHGVVVPNDKVDYDAAYKLLDQ